MTHERRMKFNFNVDKIKFYQNAAVLICLHPVSGCFYDTMAELSRSETKWPTQPKIVTIWPFPEKAC